MPKPLPAGFALGAVEPRDAVRAFQARGLLSPSYAWQDVWQAEHAGGFAIAGVTEVDVLQTAYDALGATARTGGSLADFAATLRPLLQARGLWGDVEVTDPATGETRLTRFDDARLRLIYDVNLRQSYAAGRWAAIERNKRRKPLVMYRTMRDERVRVSHAKWDGLVLPVDHPFWQTHYPPNGWRCRCRAFAVSEADVQAYRDAGVAITTQAPEVATYPWTNNRTGEVLDQPVGIDPGFAYNPGMQRGEQVARLQRNALDSTTPDAARALVQQQLRSPVVRSMVANPVPGHQLPVAMLPRTEAAALAGGAAHASAVVMLSADTLADLARTLTAADLALAQQAIAQGTRVQPAAGGAGWLLQIDGMVTLLTVQPSPTGPALASLRRLPLDQARNDPAMRGFMDAP